MLSPSGQPFSLICTSEGSPAPSFSWYKDGAPVAGATTDTLSIAKLAGSDGGVYECVAQNQITASSALSKVVPTSALSGGQVVSTDILHQQQKYYHAIFKYIFKIKDAY